MTTAGLGGRRRFAFAVLPYLVPLPAAAIGPALGLIGGTGAICLALASVGCAAGRLAAEWVRLDLAREQADRWIVTHSGQAPADALLRARIDELLDPRRRALLASGFRRAADGRLGGRGLPAMRPRLEAHRRELDDLADLLADVATPVSARGVALANRLVTHAGSPLLAPAPAARVSAVLRQVLAALPAG